MKKRTLEVVLYSAVGVAAMFVILLALNVLTAAVKQRVDLTQEKAFTLSPGTKAILKKLDTPVKIRFYWTQTEAASPETVYLKNYARRVEDLLGEFKQAGGSKIIIEKLDPQPDSDAEDSARLDGMESQMTQSGDRFYLGLSVSLLDAKAALPFLAPNRERLLEYDIVRAIARVIKPQKPVLGIMTPLPVFGLPANPMMPMGQRGNEPWAVLNELKADFEVKRVDMASEKIDDDIQVLLVVHPKDISDKAQYAIDQFVMRGGKLVAFLDPVCLADSRPQGNMPFNMPGAASNLEKLLTAWGLKLDTTKVVADLNFKMQLLGQRNQPVEAPAFLAVNKLGINPQDIATSEINTLWLPLAGAFSGTPVEGLKQTVLLHSTKESQLVDGFMANLSGESILKEFKSSGTEHPLAVRLQGRFKTAFPEGKPGEKKEDAKADNTSAGAATASLKETKEDNVVVLVADADLLYDRFAIREVPSIFGTLLMPANANLNFVQNLVEQLAGDSALIAVRSRATVSRPFTLVKQMQAAAQERYQAEIKKLEDNLAETQRRLNELQQTKEKGQRFILSPEQQREIANFRKQEAATREALKKLRKEFRRDIDALETRTKWFNIATMPLLVSVSGVAIALYKRKLTSAK